MEAASWFSLVRRVDAATIAAQPEEVLRSSVDLGSAEDDHQRVLEPMFDATTGFEWVPWIVGLAGMSLGAWLVLRTVRSEEYHSFRATAPARRSRLELAGIVAVVGLFGVIAWALGLRS
jgi:hypothetical protein